MNNRTRTSKQYQEPVGDPDRFACRAREYTASGRAFRAWENNADHQRLLAFEGTCFTHDLRLNGTDYRLLEETKACTYVPEAEGADAEARPAHRFELRRVVVWNLRSDHRASVLCWDGELGLTPEAIAAAILNRWGASENTFKRIKDRHPYHFSNCPKFEAVCQRLREI